MTNVVHVIFNYFPYEVVTHSSQLLKEQHQNIEKNIIACTSAFLMALLLRLREGKFTSIYKNVENNFQLTEDFSTTVIQELQSPPTKPNEGLVGKYNFVLNDSFGNDLHKLIDSIAGYSGTKSTSTHHLLSAIVPISIKALKEVSIRENMPVSSYLLKQKENIINTIPPHSEILTLLGITNEDSLNQTMDVHKSKKGDTEKNFSDLSNFFKNKYILAILLLVAFLVLFIWILEK